MTTIAERVAAGAAFLDEHEPGWADRIDLGKLDLHSSCRCVLGQLASDLGDDWDTWSRIVRHFGLYRADFGEELPGSDVAYGFNAGGDQTTAEYHDLTAEWTRFITERRTAE